MRAVLRGHLPARLGALAAAGALIALSGSPLVASPRATSLDLPTGERYYLFAVGGSFPDGHRLEVWKETNGLLLCSLPEAPPIGHATDPQGQSGLQITPVRCDALSYAADSRIYPTPDMQRPPQPAPSSSASEPPVTPLPSAEPDNTQPEPLSPPLIFEDVGIVPPGASALAPLVVEVDADRAVGAQPASRRPWGVATGLLGGVLFAIGRKLERFQGARR